MYRLNTIQFLSNTAGGTIHIVVPLMAYSLGASPLQIGLIGASAGATTFISSSIFGRAADVRGRLRYLRLGLATSVLATLLHLAAYDPLSLALIRGVAGFCAGIFPPALFAYAYEAGQGMGKVTSFGSLGWAAGSFAAGVVATFSGIFTVGALLYLLSLLITLRIPRQEERTIAVPLIPVALIRRNIAVYGAMLLRHTGAMGIWTLLPIFLVNLAKEERVPDLAIPALGVALPGYMLWTGLLYTVNPVMQFLVMFSIDRHPSPRLFEVGLVLSAVVFVLLAVSPTIYLMFIPMTLLGVAWATLYVGALKQVVERNVERATAAGLLTSTTSLASVLGPLLGGLTGEVLTIRGTMLAATGMTVAGLVMYVGLERKKG